MILKKNSAVMNREWIKSHNARNARDIFAVSGVACYNTQLRFQIRAKGQIVVKGSPVFRFLLASLTGLFLVGLAFSSGFVIASFQPNHAENETVPLAAPRPEDASGGPLELFREAWNLIANDFFGPLPANSDRIYGATRGLLETLNDPYTVLVEPIPRKFEQDDLGGSYGGVGLTLNRNAEGQVKLTPIRDSPAAKAGIAAGDVLLLIDDVSITSDMDISQDVAVRIRGEVGSGVTLTILRGDETLTFTIIREVIETPSVNWRMLDEAPTLGYVQIKSFTDRTSGELIEAVDELSSAGAAGLILDLRDNGGGLLQSSINVAGQFLSERVVLYENRRGESERSYMAEKGGKALDVPLVVLVNHGTASASEIVAGAIQDHERGVLIGETTFGKGSVQLIFDLSDGSSLHVTAARWFTPNRHQLDGVGLTPDILFAPDDSDATVDAQLEKAITVLLEGQ